MITRRIGTVIAAAALASSALLGTPANASTCALLSCASSDYLYGHTHGCTTSGSIRTCTIGFHGGSSCSSTLPAVCTATLNAGSLGGIGDYCQIQTTGSCSIPTEVHGTVQFVVGSGFRACATLVTTVSGVGGTASDPYYGNPVCFYP